MELKGHQDLLGHRCIILPFMDTVYPSVYLQGIKGDQGDIGIPGINGIDGEPGFNGTDGMPGPPGFNGSEGPPGPSGLQVILIIYNLLHINFSKNLEYMY